MQLQKKLTTKQSAFAAEYLKTGNIKQSAILTGITEQCAHRWLNAGLRDELASIRHELLQTCINEISLSATEAVRTLRELLQADKPVYVRLQAAKTLLENSLKAIEQAEIISRLDEIENQISNHKE